MQNKYHVMLPSKIESEEGWVIQVIYNEKKIERLHLWLQYFNLVCPIVFLHFLLK